MPAVMNLWCGWSAGTAVKKICCNERSIILCLMETLGAGGMGTVYKARDTQLERFVALKLLHKDLGSEADHDAQLQQEARIAACCESS